MKMKPLLLATVLSIGVSAFPMSAYADHWADGRYDALSAKAVLNGDFGSAPQENKDKPITREAFCALVVSALYGKQPTEAAMGEFADFSEVSPALTGYVKKAYDNNILSGTLIDGQYYIQPNTPVTREEAAVILGRALKLRVNEPSWFTDNDAVAPWAADDVAGCEKAGIFTGYTDGTFRPQSQITWAESVTMVAVAMEGGLMHPPAVTLVAGISSRGAYDDSAQFASFNAPSGLLVTGDAIYVADTGNNLIRQIKDGKTSVYAGKVMGYDAYDAALNGFYNDDKTIALFARPTAILQTSDGLLVLDTANNAIRQISGKTVSTYATADFNAPKGFCADAEGNIYVADTGNNLVRKIDPDGNISTVARVSSPHGIAYANGTLYVTDTFNHQILSIRNGTVTILAGGATGMKDHDGNPLGDYRDGTSDRAFFSNPTGICVGADGTVYVADTGNGLIRQIKNGVVGTVAGYGLSTYYISPQGLYMDGNTLYVTDSFKNTVTKLEVGSE